MKAQLLMLSAAGLLFAASAPHAAPSASLDYAQRANARAEPLLRAAGLDVQARGASVRARVAPDGRLTRLDVLHSSGSPAADRAVADVLRRIIVTEAPIGLLNGAVTLNVGPGATVETADR